MGVFRQDHIDDVDVPSCLANLGRLDELFADEPAAPLLVDLTAAGASAARFSAADRPTKAPLVTH